MQNKRKWEDGKTTARFCLENITELECLRASQGKAPHPNLRNQGYMLGDPAKHFNMRNQGYMLGDPAKHFNNKTSI